MTRVLVLAAALIIGFGGGYITNDQLDSGDRTVTIQHKRAPCHGFDCPGSGFGEGNLR